MSMKTVSLCGRYVPLISNSTQFFDSGGGGRAWPGHARGAWRSHREESFDDIGMLREQLEAVAVDLEE